jgi:pyruvate ferredoxin oxidoreductase alpha subunit
VMDRSDTISGNEGPLALEIKAALFDYGIKKEIPDYIFGLGGREVRLEDIESVYKDLGEMINGKSISKVTYLGVRE